MSDLWHFKHMTSIRSTNISLKDQRLRHYFQKIEGLENVCGKDPFSLSELFKHEPLHYM